MSFFTRQFQRWKRYSLADARADLLAGLVVALVAVPLAIGFAIASGVDPAMGIIAAVIGGLTAGILGGSEFNISGPTGAMVVVVLAVVAEHGIPGLILATVLAGFILILIGILRLGKVIEYIPSPVIVGFTAGIAVIIAFGQLDNVLGVATAHASGASFLQKTIDSFLAIPSAALAAVVLTALTIIVLILCRRYIKHVPGHIIVIALGIALVVLVPFFSGVRVVSDIGLVPSTLPPPAIPPWSWELIKAVLPAALTIAALAAIESLLSAVVADGMTDTRHNPNKELVGVGAANIASGAFGGLPITGAIARTATNIRAGGRTRIAGIAHALFVFLLIIIAAPLMARIPLAVIGGILVFTAFNMVEWDRVRHVLHTPLSDIAVMLTTFLLTVLVDLTVAIEVGLILAALLFMKRMTDLYKIEAHDEHSTTSALRAFRHKDISIYTIRGPLFFGAANRFDHALGETPGGHKPIKIIRMHHVPVIDATGLLFLESTVKRHRRIGGTVYFVGVQKSVRRNIVDAGLAQTLRDDQFVPTTRDALASAARDVAQLRGQALEVVRSELAAVDLTALDVDERGVLAVEDTDPLVDILDTVGVTRVAAFGGEAVRAGSEAVRDTVSDVLKRTRPTKKKVLRAKNRSRIQKR